MLTADVSGSALALSRRDYQYCKVVPVTGSKLLVRQQYASGLCSRNGEDTDN